MNFFHRNSIRFTHGRERVQATSVAISVALGIAIVSLAATARSGETRTWSSASGTYKTEAEFVRLKDDGTLVLKSKAGKLINVPLGKLSEADQAYARSQATEKSGSDSAKTDFAVYLGCGEVGKPGAIHQIKPDGKLAGKIQVLEPPSGLAVRGNSLVAAVAAPIVRGGQMLLVRSDGQLRRLPWSKQFPAPIAMARESDSQNLLIADNEENSVTRVTPRNEIKLLFSAPLKSDQKHYPSMSVAATADGHILFSASDPKGVYRLSPQDEKLPEPLFDEDAGVAAQPGTNRWVAMLRDELRVFDGAEEHEAIPSPAGTTFWHYHAMAFGPDGRLFVVLQTGKGMEVQSVSLDDEKFTSHFVCPEDRIRCMAIGPPMAWKP